MSLKAKKVSELRRQISKALVMKERNRLIESTFKSDMNDTLHNISALMEEFGVSEHEFVDDGEFASTLKGNPSVISCKKVRPQTVVYDAKAIYGRLGKDIGRRVVSREFVIKDMDGLVELMKWCGVKPSQFKRFIDVRYSLDEKALDNIYETGVISKEDLKGCYTVKSGKEYLRITAKPAVRSGKD